MGCDTSTCRPSSPEALEEYLEQMRGERWDGSAEAEACGTAPAGPAAERGADERRAAHGAPPRVGEAGVSCSADAAAEEFQRRVDMKARCELLAQRQQQLAALESTGRDFNDTHRELLGRCWDRRKQEHFPRTTLHILSAVQRYCLLTGLPGAAPWPPHPPSSVQVAGGGTRTTGPSAGGETPPEAAGALAREAQEASVHGRRGRRTTGGRISVWASSRSPPARERRTQRRSHWFSVIGESGLLHRVVPAPAASPVGSPHGGVPHHGSPWRHRSGAWPNGGGGGGGAPLPGEREPAARRMTAMQRPPSLLPVDRPGHATAGSPRRDAVQGEARYAGACDVFAFRLASGEAPAVECSFLREHGQLPAHGVTIRHWNRVELLRPDLPSLTNMVFATVATPASAAHGHYSPPHHHHHHYHPPHASCASHNASFASVTAGSVSQLGHNASFASWTGTAPGSSPRQPLTMLPTSTHVFCESHCCHIDDGSPMEKSNANSCHTLGERVGHLCSSSCQHAMTATLAHQSPKLMAPFLSAFADTPSNGTAAPWPSGWEGSGEEHFAISFASPRHHCGHAAAAASGPRAEVSRGVAEQDSTTPSDVFPEIAVACHTLSLPCAQFNSLPLVLQSHPGTSHHSQDDLLFVSLLLSQQRQQLQMCGHGRRHTGVDPSRATQVLTWLSGGTQAVDVKSAAVGGEADVRGGAATEEPQSSRHRGGDPHRRCQWQRPASPDPGDEAVGVVAAATTTGPSGRPVPLSSTATASPSPAPFSFSSHDMPASMPLVPQPSDSEPVGEGSPTGSAGTFHLIPSPEEGTAHSSSSPHGVPRHTTAHPVGRSGSIQTTRTRRLTASGGLMGRLSPNGGGVSGTSVLSQMSRQPTAVALVVSSFEAAIHPSRWREMNYDRDAICIDTTRVVNRRRYGEGVITSVMYGGVCCVECSSSAGIAELEDHLDVLRWQTERRPDTEVASAAAAGESSKRGFSLGRLLRSFRGHGKARKPLGKPLPVNGGLPSPSPAGHGSPTATRGGQAAAAASGSFSDGGAGSGGGGGGGGSSSAVGETGVQFRITFRVGGRSLVEDVIQHFQQQLQAMPGAELPAADGSGAGASSRMESPDLLGTINATMELLNEWTDAASMARFLHSWAHHLLDHPELAQPVSLFLQRFPGIAPYVRHTAFHKPSSDAADTLGTTHDDVDDYDDDDDEESDRGDVSDDERHGHDDEPVGACNLSDFLHEVASGNGDGEAAADASQVDPSCTRATCDSVDELRECVEHSRRYSSQHASQRLDNGGLGRLSIVKPAWRIPPFNCFYAPPAQALAVSAPDTPLESTHCHTDDAPCSASQYCRRRAHGRRLRRGSVRQMHQQNSSRVKDHVDTASVRSVESKATQQFVNDGRRMPRSLPSAASIASLPSTRIPSGNPDDRPELLKCGGGQSRGGGGRGGSCDTGVRCSLDDGRDEYWNTCTTLSFDALDDDLLARGSNVPPGDGRVVTPATTAAGPAPPSRLLSATESLCGSPTGCEKSVSRRCNGTGGQENTMNVGETSGATGPATKNTTDVVPLPLYGPVAKRHAGREHGEEPRVVVVVQAAELPPVLAPSDRTRASSSVSRRSVPKRPHRLLTKRPLPIVAPASPTVVPQRHIGGSRSESRAPETPNCIPSHPTSVASTTSHVVVVSQPREKPHMVESPSSISVRRVRNVAMRSTGFTSISGGEPLSPRSGLRSSRETPQSSTVKRPLPTSQRGSAEDAGASQEATCHPSSGSVELTPLISEWLALGGSELFGLSRTADAVEASAASLAMEEPVAAGPSRVDVWTDMASNSSTIEGVAMQKSALLQSLLTEVHPVIADTERNFLDLLPTPMNYEEATLQSLWDITSLEVKALAAELVEARETRFLAEELLESAEEQLRVLRRSFLPTTDTRDVDPLCVFLLAMLDDVDELPLPGLAELDSADWLSCLCALLTNPLNHVRHINVAWPLTLESLPQLGMLGGLLHSEHAMVSVETITLHCEHLFCTAREMQVLLKNREEKLQERVRRQLHLWEEQHAQGLKRRSTLEPKWNKGHSGDVRCDLATTASGANGSSSPTWGGDSGTDVPLSSSSTARLGVESSANGARGDAGLPPGRKSLRPRRLFRPLGLITGITGNGGSASPVSTPVTMNLTTLMSSVRHSQHYGVDAVSMVLPGAVRCEFEKQQRGSPDLPSTGADDEKTVPPVVLTAAGPLTIDEIQTALMSLLANAMENHHQPNFALHLQGFPTAVCFKSRFVMCRAEVAFIRHKQLEQFNEELRDLSYAGSAWSWPPSDPPASENDLLHQTLTLRKQQEKRQEQSLFMRLTKAHRSRQAVETSALRPDVVEERRSDDVPLFSGILPLMATAEAAVPTTGKELFDLLMQSLHLSPQSTQGAAAGDINSFGQRELDAPVAKE